MQYKSATTIVKGDVAGCLHNFGVVLVRMSEETKHCGVSTAPSLNVVSTTASRRCVVLIEFVGSVTTIPEQRGGDDVLLVGIIPEESVASNVRSDNRRRKNQWSPSSTDTKEVINVKTVLKGLQRKANIMSFKAKNFHSSIP